MYVYYACTISCSVQVHIQYFLTSPPPSISSSHMHSLSLFSLFTVPNTGLVLWLQKYWAMLVKRMYASVRFWQAMAAQLLIPLLFVALAMVMAKTTLFNDNASDPKRRLGLENAGLSSNLTLFWVEFGDGGPINDTAGNFTSFFDSMDEVSIYSCT